MTEKKHKTTLDGPLESRFHVVATGANTVSFCFPEHNDRLEKGGNIIINGVEYHCSFYLERNEKGEWSEIRNLYSSRAMSFKAFDGFTEAARKRFKAILLPWAVEWLESQAGKLLRFYGERARLETAIIAELEKLDKARAEATEAQKRYDVLVSAQSELIEKGSV